jgi:hypothetical protein
VIDPTDLQHEPLDNSAITSEILLEFPILAEAIEEMTEDTLSAPISPYESESPDVHQYPELNGIVGQEKT